jgi:hypothetical protein
MPSHDYEFTSVEVPRPQKLSSFGDVNCIAIDQSVIYENADSAMLFAKIMTQHALCASLKQKLVLKLLGEHVSAASRALLSLDRNIERNTVFDLVLREYGDEDFKQTFGSLRNTLKGLDDVRNRLAHRLWGKATTSTGDSYVILMPLTSLHPGQISGVEFGLSIEKNPHNAFPERVQEEIKKQWPNLAEVEVWTLGDFVATSLAMNAYIHTMLALSDALRPFAPYLANRMASRQELLDLIAEKKLLSVSASVYFNLRFSDQLGRDFATGR